jgi:hypothetical protein
MHRSVLLKPFSRMHSLSRVSTQRPARRHRLSRVDRARQGRRMLDRAALLCSRQDGLLMAIHYF